ncbi:MAG: phosphotransferase [Winogradskyella sp.]|nr:phosphotransferase [Winogradskyella sp.]
MDSSLINHIESQLGEPIKNYQTVSGGDISEAYKLTTNSAVFFLKIHSSPNALTMFEAEKAGLMLISSTNTIKTPKILLCGSFKEWSFLVMEFIASKSPNSKDFKLLGHKLAELHQITSNNFGLTNDNFIGSLPQFNTLNSTWSTFYCHQRLQPQLRLAQNKKLLNPNECPDELVILNRMEELCKNIKPSLLHGDLWSGNYQISKDGTPYLIDPAVFYGHNEVDIAMSLLFGGFGDSFYTAYFNTFKKDNGFDDRIQLYQLYYYLVHLNLFGRSYYPAVAQILKQQFKM